MSYPKVSVVLTSYNKEKYIGIAIESVLKQTYTDFELIIADDGSTDKSVEVIEKYKKQDSRIRGYYFKENQGIPSAHNKAIEMATGEYIAMLDCDDFWEKEKLEKQVRLLDARKEYGACFSWIKVVDENGAEVSSDQCEQRDIMWNSPNHVQSEWLRQFFAEGCKLGNPSMMVRKSIINEVGAYSYGLKQLQDYELFIRILKKSNVHVLQEKLVNYRWFIGENKNTSYDNRQNSNRTNIEYYLIGQRFFEDMPENLFEDVFSGYFRAEKIQKETTLLERQSILYRKYYLCPAAGELIAVEKEYSLLNNGSDGRNEKKGVTSSEFSKKLGEVILYDPKYYMPIESDEFVESLKKQLDEAKKEWYKAAAYTKELEIKEIENSSIVMKKQEYIEELESKEREGAAIVRQQQRYIEELEEKEREGAVIVKQQQQYIGELEQRCREAFGLYEESKNYIAELEKRVREHGE